MTVLHKALQVAQRESGVITRLLHSETPFTSQHSPSSHKVLDSAIRSTNGEMCITTWNARGLKSGEPYLNHLSESSSDVIIVTEHWLWPFEAHKLAQVNKNFHAEVVTDTRLNENSDLHRGIGGLV